MWKTLWEASDVWSALLFENLPQRKKNLFSYSIKIPLNMILQVGMHAQLLNQQASKPWSVDICVTVHCIDLDHNWFVLFGFHVL